MILNRLWELYTNPQDEWRAINDKHDNMLYSVSHIMIIALVPSICSYFSAVFLGWYINFDDVVTLSPMAAMAASVSVYCLLVSGVFTLAFIAWRLAMYFGAKPTYTQCLELSSYTATPLFISGFAALFPEIWFLALVGAVGLTYSIKLLFTGVPITIDIDPSKRRVYILSLVTCSLLMLFGLMTIMLNVWDGGLILN
jgi:hypothetical protein